MADARRRDILNDRKRLSQQWQKKFQANSRLQNGSTNTHANDVAQTGTAISASISAQPNTHPQQTLVSSSVHAGIGGNTQDMLQTQQMQQSLLLNPHAKVFIPRPAQNNTHSPRQHNNISSAYNTPPHPQTTTTTTTALPPPSLPPPPSAHPYFSYSPAYTQNSEILGYANTANSLTGTPIAGYPAHTALQSTPEQRMAPRIVAQIPLAGNSSDAYALWNSTNNPSQNSNERPVGMQMSSRPAQPQHSLHYEYGTQRYPHAMNTAYTRNTAAPSDNTSVKENSTQDSAEDSESDTSSASSSALNNWKAPPRKDPVQMGLENAESAEQRCTQWEHSAELLNAARKQLFAALIDSAAKAPAVVMPQTPIPPKREKRAKQAKQQNSEGEKEQNEQNEQNEQHNSSEQAPVKQTETTEKKDSESHKEETPNAPPSDTNTANNGTAGTTENPPESHSKLKRPVSLSRTVVVNTISLAVLPLLRKSVAAGTATLSSFLSTFALILRVERHFAYHELWCEGAPFGPFMSSSSDSNASNSSNSSRTDDVECTRVQQHP